MPLLARNVFIIGYQGTGSSRRPTEFLILLRRYVQQARELSTLAGTSGVIHVTSCADAKQLLDILGYRTRPDCGKSSTYVETADARRAFLTIDSGFPLPELEKTLQGGEPFSYPYPSSQVPIALTERDWAAASNAGRPRPDRCAFARLTLSRLYYAWAHVDPETQAALLHSPGLKKLFPLPRPWIFTAVTFASNRAASSCPAAPPTSRHGRDLVGANPQSHAEFVPRLLTKDNGWLAAYFDSLSRIPPEQQAHFVESPRMRHCYEALRGKTLSPSATSSVFRPDPTLLLLTTRMQWEANGDPHVPGSLQAWKNILQQKAIAERRPQRECRNQEA